MNSCDKEMLENEMEIKTKANQENRKYETEKEDKR